MFRSAAAVTSRRAGSAAAAARCMSSASPAAAAAAAAAAPPSVREGREPTFKTYSRRQAASDITVTVFGATGFVGRNMVHHLCKAGAQVVLPFRGDGQNARYLKVMGDLGQVVHMPVNPRDPASMERAVQGSTVVINLMGSNFEPVPAAFDNALARRAMGYASALTFDEVHGTLARDVARYSARNGVRRLIHFSALGAHLDSPSRFLASKAKGEAHVRHEFPDATILRPGHVFGHDDFFLNRFARMCWSTLPRVIDAQSERQLQPVYVEDVVRAAINAIETRESHGRTYELGGKERYDFVALLKAIEVQCDRKMNVLHADLATALKFQIFEELALPRQLLLSSRDLVIRDALDSTVSKHARGIEELGVNPAGLSDHFEALMFKWAEDKYFEGFMEA